MSNVLQRALAALVMAAATASVQAYAPAVSATDLIAVEDVYLHDEEPQADRTFAQLSHGQRAARLAVQLPSAVKLSTVLDGPAGAGTENNAEAPMLVLAGLAAMCFIARRDRRASPKYSPRNAASL